jgi:hypothetical protein
MMPPTIVTPATILSIFIILSLKNFAFSGGEDGNPSDAEKYCEVSDPSDADANGVVIDSSRCTETGTVDDDDDGWCEGVNLDGWE